MRNEIDILQTLRDRQLSWGLSALSVLGIFLLAISLSRAFSFGWRPVMFLHIILYAIVLCTAIFSSKLSYWFRAIIIVLVPFIIGVAGLLTWGLAALGLPALFVYCILTVLLFGKVPGIIAAALSTMITGIAGFLFCSGILILDFNPQVYLVSSITWVGTVVAIAVSAGIIVVAVGTLNREIEILVQTLQERDEEMSGIIRKLETEMAERKHAEDQRRELEKRLQRAKKMEALGTLAGGVAHDLNNILVGSVSYPDLLLAQLHEESPLRKPIETIRRSGVKAAQIVQDLLILTRRAVPSASVVNINSIITDYFSSPEYQKLKSFHSNVEIELRLKEGLPNILGSSIHLLKTIMNLISNASEAMHNGGKIVVSTSHEHTVAATGLFEEIKDGHYVILSVSDEGIGISPDEIKKIFEPFYTKKVMGWSGTGLGMTVVLSTVKDHRGHIHITSVPEKGTTIILYFPVTDEKIPQPRYFASVREYMGKGESILIVDDVKEQREIAAEMLHALGYSVNTVASGEDAISYLEKNPMDLLVLDMRMEPGMDGLDTYRKALEIKPLQKAIITSGYTETWRVREAKKLGAGTYIKKPYLLNDLGVAIRMELDR